MIDLLLSIEDITKAELDQRLRETSLIHAVPTKKEIKEWPYKCGLAVSPSCIIGAMLIRDNKKTGVITGFHYIIDRGKTQMRLEVDTKNYPLTGSQVEYFTKIYNKKIRHKLHPSRGGKFFWEHGFYMKHGDYKKIYYRTKGYREKYQKGLNETYGTTGLTSPVQIQEVRDKISKSIQDKYGVPWFLNRGSHYSAVTETMMEKYGVENIFHSDNVQHEIQVNFGSGSSKKEQKLVEYLVSDLKLIDSSFYDESENQQIIVADVENKKAYHVDFYNPKNRIIVEFYGDYWHCNPLKFKADYFHPHKKKTAGQLWEIDEQRIKQIKKITGYRVFIIWEHDWDKNREEVKATLKKAIQ